MNEGRALFSELDATVALGLAGLRQRFHTRGPKVGQSFFDHMVGGARTLCGLGSLFGLDQDELRLCVAAFSVHDLNKCDGAGERGFKAIADDAVFVDRIFTEARLDEFLGPLGGLDPWRRDILVLCRNHGSHSAVGGDLLVPAADATRLGLRRLQTLVPVLQAIDVVDVARATGRDENWRTFVARVNAVRNAKALPQVVVDTTPPPGRRSWSIDGLEGGLFEASSAKEGRTS